MEQSENEIVPEGCSSGIRMFRIYEDDLSELERTLPQFAEALMPLLSARLRTQLRRCQTILSNVRWNYGPPTDVEMIPADET